MDTMTTIDTRADEAPAGPSDADLLARVRDGDADAYGELYLRHEPAATSLARYLTRANHEADDVVGDAFARVLRAIHGGAGPTEAFRPYLLTAVRRTVWRRSEEAAHHRLAASEDEAEMLDLRLAVEPEDHTDEGLVLRAFQELPERWQLVLWHTEIEGQPPAAVAPLLGLSPNATAALAVRAREGLRQAYLQAHLQSRPAESCRFSVEHLGAFVRDGLGKRDSAKVEAHLADCERCRDLQSDLGSLNKALRGVVGPAVLGAGAAQYLSGAGDATTGGAEAAGHVHDAAHRLRFPHALGLAGAAAALLVTLGVSSDLARAVPPPPLDTGDAVTVAAAGPLVVDVALAGTEGADTPGVQPQRCGGAVLPLSLPEGATPTGAALVEASGREPTVVDPATADSYTPVDDGGATLVGRDGACVSNLIEVLSEAPPETALLVTFLDELGQLNILLVPELVGVVQDSLHRLGQLAETLDQQLQAYLEALSQAADELTGTSGSVTGGSGASGTVGLPDVPGGVPDLAPLPPATGGVGGVVDDVAGGVGGVIDGVLGGVGGVVGGVGGVVGGVLGG